MAFAGDKSIESSETFVHIDLFGISDTILFLFFVVVQVVLSTLNLENINFSILFFK